MHVWNELNGDLLIKIQCFILGLLCICWLDPYLFSTAFLILCRHLPSELYQWSWWRIGCSITSFYSIRIIRSKFLQNINNWNTYFGLMHLLRYNYLQCVAMLYFFKRHVLINKEKSLWNLKIFDLCSNFDTWFLCYCLFITCTHYFDSYSSNNDHVWIIVC